MAEAFHSAVRGMIHLTHSYREHGSGVAERVARKRVTASFSKPSSLEGLVIMSPLHVLRIRPAGRRPRPLMTW